MGGRRRKDGRERRNSGVGEETVRVGEETVRVGEKTIGVGAGAKAGAGSSDPPGRTLRRYRKPGMETAKHFLE